MIKYFVGFITVIFSRKIPVKHHQFAMAADKLINALIATRFVVGHKLRPALLIQFVIVHPLLTGFCTGVGNIFRTGIAVINAGIIAVGCPALILPGTVTRRAFANFRRDGIIKCFIIKIVEAACVLSGCAAIMDAPRAQGDIAVHDPVNGAVIVAISVFTTAVAGGGLLNKDIASEVSAEVGKLR